MLKILIATALATIGAAAVSPGERAKAMKLVAKSLRSKTFGQIRIGETLVETDMVIVPLDFSTAKPVDKAEGDTALVAFARSLCTIDVVQVLAKNDFSLRFDLRINGAPLATRTVTPVECAAHFAQNAGFGTDTLIAPIAGREKLPAFSFKGLTAGEPLSPAVLDACELLFNRTPKLVHCYYGALDVAGTKLFGSADFYRGMLSSIQMTVSAYQAATLLDALNAKYGRPCRSETLIWQNKLGAQFDNPTYTWCFRSGNLRFTARDEKRDEGELAYTDVNAPPAPKPVINF